MNKPKVLALILAGGKGGRLGSLTASRAKPVMPFGANYRLIDFALSNCRHSELNDVWVVEQYELQSLNEHLAGGRPWDLDRTYGGLRLLPPHEVRDDEDEAGGFAGGNAEAIYRHRHAIARFAPDVLLVMSADHVYKLDYRDLVEAHVASGAEVTIVTTKLPSHESASRFGVVQCEDGRVTGFDYKPKEPRGDLVTTEVFAYDTRRLLARLEALVEEEDADALEDFGHKLLPAMIEAGSARELRFEAYWLDVGTIRAYHRAHMDLVDGVGPRLDEPDWPILTLGAQRAPAAIFRSAEVRDTLVASGCKVHGRVVRSVLAPGVVVEEGATVTECVLLPDVRVTRGVVLERAIVDSGVVVTTETKCERDEESGIAIYGEGAAPEADAETERVGR